MKFHAISHKKIIPEWPASIVDELVGFQITRSGKRFLTVGTLMRLFLNLHEFFSFFNIIKMCSLVGRDILGDLKHGF